MNNETRQALISFVLSTASAVCKSSTFNGDAWHRTSCPVPEADRLVERLKADETII